MIPLPVLPRRKVPAYNSHYGNDCRRVAQIGVRVKGEISPHLTSKAVSLNETSISPCPPLKPTMEEVDISSRFPPGESIPRHYDRPGVKNHLSRRHCSQAPHPQCNLP